MNSALLQQLKESLIDEKNRLLQELSRFTFKNKEGDFEVKGPIFSDELDLDTEADEAEDFSALLGLENQLKGKLLSIENALLKIEKGNFGICEKCREKIEEERLKAEPSAAFCIGCIKE